MAIQVRCDFTPAEFDLLRAALATYREERHAYSENHECDPAARRVAKSTVLRTDDLLRKVNGV